jgi:hypothetical protein
MSFAIRDCTSPVRVDRGAQIVHDALADLVGDPGLRDPDHPADDRQRDHPADEQRQQFGVSVRDRPVQHAAQQEWADHAEARGQKDQREQAAQPRAIRREQPADSPQRNGRGRNLLRAELTLLLVAPPARPSLCEGLAAQGRSPSRSVVSLTCHILLAPRALPVGRRGGTRPGRGEQLLPAR